MAARRVDLSLELLGRFGFLARGLVYVAIGLLAARVAVLQRGRATGPGGALKRIVAFENGHASLLVVTAGLLALAAFRLAQARAARGFPRVGFLGGAFGALLFAATAAGLLFGLTAATAEDPLLLWGAWLLSRPWGRALLLAGGGTAAVIGVVLVVRVLLGRLPRDFDAAVIARGRKASARRLALFGVLTHGVVVTTIGVSIVQAAFDLDPRELLGTAGALRRLRLLGSPVVFGVVAAGLVAYGVSLLVLAAHRRKSLR